MTEKKKGFFGKLIDRIDKKLEKKAEQKGCCCCDDSPEKEECCR